MAENQPSNDSTSGSEELSVSKTEPETIKLSPSKNRRDQLDSSDTLTGIYQYGFSGPLPPPQVLKAYDLVQSGLAERIVGLAEEQARHRMSLEKTVVLGDSKRAWAGLVAAFCLSCLFTGISYDLIKNDKQVAGTILGTGSLATLVSTFIYGTNKRAEEREKKRQDLLGSAEKEAS